MNLLCPCIAPAIKVNNTKIFIIGGLVLNKCTKFLKISSQVLVFDMSTEKYVRFELKSLLVLKISTLELK